MSAPLKKCFMKPRSYKKSKNFPGDTLSDKGLSEYLFVRNLALYKHLSHRKFCSDCACTMQKSNMKFSINPTITREEICNSLSQWGGGGIQCYSIRGHTQARKYRGMWGCNTPQSFLRLENSEAVGNSGGLHSFPKSLEFSDCHSYLSLSDCHSHLSLKIMTTITYKCFNRF